MMFPQHAFFLAFCAFLQCNPSKRVLGNSTCFPHESEEIENYDHQMKIPEKGPNYMICKHLPQFCSANLNWFVHFELVSPKNMRNRFCINYLRRIP
jgi:hypothetical protein